MTKRNVGVAAAHPDMADRDFYVTGESYAGHYVPAVSNRIFLENNKPEVEKKINLKGFAIGNGLTDPGIQYGGYSDYALRNGLISTGTGRVVKAVRLVALSYFKTHSVWEVSIRKPRALTLKPVL